MEHHTTLNLKLTTYQELKELAAAKRVSVGTAIVALMKILSHEVKYRETPERLVEYQKLSEGEKWYTCHVYWSFQEVKASSDLLSALTLVPSWHFVPTLHRYEKLSASKSYLTSCQTSTLASS